MEVAQIGTNFLTNLFETPGVKQTYHMFKKLRELTSPIYIRIMKHLPKDEALSIRILMNLQIWVKKTLLPYMEQTCILYMRMFLGSEFAYSHFNVPIGLKNNFQKYNYYMILL